MKFNFVAVTLREMCPNTEFFLVRIWTLFTQCKIKTRFLKSTIYWDVVLERSLSSSECEKVRRFLYPRVHKAKYGSLNKTFRSKKNTFMNLSNYIKFWRIYISNFSKLTNWVYQLQLTEDCQKNNVRLCLISPQNFSLSNCITRYSLKAKGS